MLKLKKKMDSVVEKDLQSTIKGKGIATEEQYPKNWPKSFDLNSSLAIFSNKNG